MVNRRVRLIIIFAYLSCVFFTLALLLNINAVVPYMYVDGAKGNAQLSDFDFKSYVARVSDEAEFYNNMLLSPDEIINHSPDSYSFDRETQYATARIRFFVPDGNYVIFGNSPEYASRIYINGELMGEFGKIDETDETNNIYRVAAFEYAAEPIDGVIELVTQNAAVIRDDPSFYGYFIGEQETARRYQLCAIIYYLLPIGILITCTLFYLGYFLFMPMLRTNLWFALISLAFCLLAAVSNEKLIFSIFPILDYRFEFLAEKCSLVLINVFYLLFSRALFNDFIPKKFVASILAINALLMLLLLTLPISLTSRHLIIITAMLAVTLAVSIACITFNIRRLNEAQFVSFFGQVVFMLCGISDLLHMTLYKNAFLIIPPNSATIGMLLFVFAQMAALYLQNNKAVENERRLAIENSSLEKLNNLKSKFLGNISHELKTPLTVVSNYAQLTQKRAENKELADEYTAQKMKLVASEAERMAVMVNQLLEFARSDNPSVEYNFGAVNVSQLLKHIVDTYYPVLNKNRNTIRLVTPDTLPDVWADRERITQVLVNLINNAVKFTKNGVITLGAKPLEACEKVEIYVEDTGQGIDEAQKQHLFERFFTIDGDKTGEIREIINSGTGLGLSICKEIIEAHGERITIQSKRGEGTRVFFSLKANYDRGSGKFEANDTSY